MNSPVKKINKIGTIKERFSQTKLYFAQAVIPGIYSQLLNSLGDCYGIILGNYKEIKNVKSIDSNSNLEENNLNIIVYKIIFIYDLIYFSDPKEMQKLFNKIRENEMDHTIIGIISARKFSYPNMSAKDQLFYLNARSVLCDSEYPILMGCFSHNNQEFEENNMKMVTFESRVYCFSNRTNTFSSLPYEQINMKNSNYSQNIETLNTATNLIVTKNKEDFNNINVNVDRLTTIINQQCSDLDVKEKELRQKKIQLKEELKENIRSLQILSAYEK